MLYMILIIKIIFGVLSMSQRVQGVAVLLAVAFTALVVSLLMTKNLPLSLAVTSIVTPLVMIVRLLSFFR